jgi:uncharacterized protein (DUF58 family)
MGMVQALRAWWRTKSNTWLDMRIAPGPHTIGKRSVFILPTRQGFYLAFFLLAMLLACINYNLALGYMLTFFVFSVALGAMHRTHQNLLGTRIEALPAQPVFAGSRAEWHIALENPSQQFKYALSIAPQGNKHAPDAALSSAQCSLPNKAQATPRLSLAPLPRGIHRLPKLEIASRYPLGLWRAWSYATPVDRITVYPEPRSPLPHFLPLPHINTRTTVAVNSTLDTQGDAVSHIENTASATARSIHWPALAKGQLAQRMLENDTPITQGVLLSLAGCTTAGLEAQLSQLCFAIQHCEANALPFVLHLGGQYYPASQQASCHPAHLHQCLEALAGYGN